MALTSHWVVQPGGTAGVRFGSAVCATVDAVGASVMRLATHVHLGVMPLGLYETGSTIFWLGIASLHSLAVGLGLRGEALRGEGEVLPGALDSSVLPCSGILTPVASSNFFWYFLRNDILAAF